MLSSPKSSLIYFVLFVIFLFVLLCTFVILLFYRYQRKMIAYNKEMESVKTAHQNMLLQSQIEVQEKTFQHIAREIHDNIGQKLTLAKLYLNTLSYTDMEQIRSSVADSLSLMTESINSLSDVSRSMGTEVLLNNGIVKGIELELSNLQKSGIYKCNYKVSGSEIFLNSNTEIVLFRIVQECISNFIKHAGGNEITINLNYTSNELSLEIQDYGKGFDAEAASNGAGLANIKKRAALLSGRSNIVSGRNGTTIIITIPMNEATKQINLN